MTEVAAAIIRNKENKILICRRGPGGSTSFLWEFPGGKREPGETLEQCLMRECDEELGVRISVGEIFDTTSYNYPESTIDFTFYNANIICGDMVPTVHEEVLWVSPEDLHLYEFCPADIDIIRRLR